MVHAVQFLTQIFAVRNALLVELNRFLSNLDTMQTFWYATAAIYTDQVVCHLLNNFVLIRTRF